MGDRFKSAAAYLGRQGAREVASFLDELLVSAHKYHRHPEDRERYYGACLLEVQSGDFGKVVMHFLVDWGGPSTARALVKTGRGRLMKRLNEWRHVRDEEIDTLSRSTLWQADFRRIAADLCEVFYELERMPQATVGGKHRFFGSTAAGKTLHLLLPSLCPPWDQKIIRAPLHLDGDAWSYLVYLRALRDVLAEAGLAGSLSSNQTPIASIVRKHRSLRDAIAPLEYDEPITKILDEALYDPHFRNRWLMTRLATSETLTW